MNLKLEILKEHSKHNTLKIAAFISDDKQKFAELVQLFLGESCRVSQRAAWIMRTVFEKYPEMIAPYIRQIIENLEISTSDAVKRNTLKILQNYEIPEDLQGIAANTCFGFVASKKEAVAIKVFAMTVIYNISKNAPELQRELKIIIEDQLPFASAGFISRGTKILKAMAKTTQIRKIII